MARASVSLFAQQKFDSAQDDRQGFYFAIIHSYQCKFETNTLTKHHKYSIMFHVIARVTSSLFTLTYYLIRGYGGIGRRARFRILCSFVQVRPLLPAPKGCFGILFCVGNRVRKNRTAFWFSLAKCARQERNKMP